MRLQDAKPGTMIVILYRNSLNVSSYIELMGVLHDWKEFAFDAWERGKRLSQIQFEEFQRVRNLTVLWKAELPSAMVTRYGSILLPNVILYIAERAKREKTDDYTAMVRGIQSGDLRRKDGHLVLEERLERQIEGESGNGHLLLR